VPPERLGETAEGSPVTVVEYGGRLWRLDGYRLLELTAETATIETAPRSGRKSERELIRRA
jgi:hypothetical protein